MPNTVESTPASGGFAPREVEILLSALADNVLTRQGRDFARIDAGGTSFFVARIPQVVPLTSWPADYSPEYIAELERRLATLDQAEPLFEFTDDSEDEPQKP